LVTATRNRLVQAHGRDRQGLSHRFQEAAQGVETRGDDVPLDSADRRLLRSSSSGQLGLIQSMPPPCLAYQRSAPYDSLPWAHSFQDRTNLL
jgi:hypothetical protein